MPTCGHQSKVKRVLDDLNIKIDIELNYTFYSLGRSKQHCPSDGDFVKAAIEDEIENIELINKNLADLIQKPRTRKSTNEKRAQQIEENKNQIKKLKQVLLTEKVMKFEYDLIWNGEVIDTASTKFQAISLKNEYCIAFNTTRIEIKKVKKVLED